MLLEKNISKLCVILALLISSCASYNIPNVRLHSEIPFVDGPEAVYVETVSKKQGVINAKDWQSLRPYMLMLHIDDWAVIKKHWLENCRINRDQCNVVVKSIDKVVKRLDKIIEAVNEKN